MERAVRLNADMDKEGVGSLRNARADGGARRPHTPHVSDTWP
jgi:hypothetical protein